MNLGAAGPPQRGSQRVNRQGRAVASARQMRARGIGEGAEFGEIPSAAKRRAVAGQHDPGHRRVQLRHGQRLQQRGTGVGGERVVPLRPVEPDPQHVSVALCLHRIGEFGHADRAAFGEPPGELRTCLQCRVSQRLGQHAGQRGAVGLHRAQHVVAHAAGMRPAFTPLPQLGKSVGHRVDGDHSTVRAGFLGQGESRCLQT